MSFSQGPSDASPRNQVAAAGAPATVPTGDKIGVAAKALVRCILPLLERGAGLLRTHLRTVIAHRVFICGGSIVVEVNGAISIPTLLTVISMAMTCLLPSGLLIVVIVQIACGFLVCTTLRWTGFPMST